MTERSVVVRLKLLSQDFTAGARAAGSSMRDLNKEIATGARTSKADVEQLGRAGLVAGTALLGGFAMATKATLDFDKQLSAVKAVSGATTSEMVKLRQAALDAGRDTKFSAAEAAQATAELAKVGISTADILGGGLRGALDLAAAGNLDLSTAATIAGQAMKIFNLEGKDVGRIADTLAAGANKSAADVNQLGQSLMQGGLAAQQAGLGLEETVGTLSAFADRAMLGSDAGTSLKTMLQRLAAPSKEAQAEMDRLGITAYDAGGNFVGMANFAANLQNALSRLTPEQRNAALATIFGADATRAATVLYEEGSAGIRDYIQSVTDQGAAQRMASTMTDNLAGDLEELGGSIETALIEGGSQATGVLRGLVQGATGAVNAFSELPDGVQAGGMALLGLGGAALTAGGGLLYILPKVQQVKDTLADMPRVAGAAGGALKGLAIAGGVVAGLTAIAAAGDAVQRALMETPPTVEEFTASMIKLQRTGDATKELKGVADAIGEINSYADSGVVGFLNDLAPDNTGLREAKEELQGFDAALAKMVGDGNADLAANSVGELASMLRESGYSTQQIQDMLPAYNEALLASSNAAATNADATGGMAGQSQAAAGAMEQEASAAEQLEGALASLNGVVMSSAEAEIAFEASIDDVTAALEKNGHEFNIDTEAGRANRQAMIDAAKAAQDHAVAVAEQSGSVEQGTAVLGGHIERLRATMLAAGLTDEQINELIGTYTQMPALKQTNVNAPGATTATQHVRDLNTSLSHVPGWKDVTVNVHTGLAHNALRTLQNSINAMTGKNIPMGVLRAMHSGGWVAGPPSGDIHPALLEGGEAVIPADSAAKNRPIVQALIDGRALQRFATGGWVGRGGGGTPAATGPAAMVNVERMSVTQPADITDVAEDLWFRVRAKGFV